MRRLLTSTLAAMAVFAAGAAQAQEDTIKLGLLTTQERQVQARYRAAGLVLERRYRLAEWSTLVMRG